MGYLEEKANSLRDEEYRKAVTYTVGSAAVTAFFGATSAKKALEGDLDTASSGFMMAGFSGTLAKGLYSQTQKLEEEINDDIFEENESYDLDFYSVD